MSVRRTKIKTIQVVSTCSHCGQEVAETTKGNAYRHGFNRYKKAVSVGQQQFSQEDGRACEGSGKQVKYIRQTSYKPRRRYRTTSSIKEEAS